MAKITNADCAAFFAEFPDFTRNDKHTTEQAFNRLAKTRAWNPESKTFRKRWMQCFGKPFIMPKPSIASAAAPSTTSSDSDLLLLSALDELKIGDDREPIPDDDTTPVSTSTSNDGVDLRYFDHFPDFRPNQKASLRKEVKRLGRREGWNSRRIREETARACADEFHHFFGKEDKLAVWQLICSDLTTENIPSSITQCKKVCKVAYAQMYNSVNDITAIEKLSCEHLRLH